MACGGASHQRDCISLDPVTGTWQTTYTWNSPARFGHVSWALSGSGEFLMGGFGAYVQPG